MATNLEQAIINELKALRNDLMKAINSNKYKAPNDRKYASRDNSDNSSNDLDKKRKDMLDEYSRQTDTLKVVRGNFGKLSRDILKEALPSIRILKEGFGNARDSLKEYTKYSDKKYRESAQGMFEVFSKIIKKGQSFEQGFNDIFESQQKLKDAIEKTLRDASAKKGKGEGLKQAKDALNNLRKSPHGTTILKHIDQETLDALNSGKISNKKLKELNAALSQVMGGTLKGAKSASSVIPNLMNSMRGTLVSSIGTLLTTLGPKAINQAIKDYQSNRYYGVGGTTYASNILNNIGMSEEERSQVVGKNMQLFQLLGKGNANAPFIGQGVGGNNSDIHQLQLDMLHQFGLYGKDAMNEVVKNMNIVFKSGFALTKDNLLEFNQNLAAAARLAGEAPDVMKDFYSELGDTGQLALLRQSMQGKSDKEQMDAIMQNTAIIVKLNKNLGMNAEEIKKQNQMAFNASHADFLQTVMQGIGTNMAAGALKKFNKNDNRSTDEIAQSLAFAQADLPTQTSILNSGAFKGKTETEVRQQAANDLLQSRQLGELNRKAGFTTALGQGQNIINAQTTGAAAQLYQEINRRFNPLVAGESGVGSVAAVGVGARGTSNNTVTQDVTTSLDAMKTVIGNEQSGVIEALIEFKTTLTSMAGNPVGQVVGGAVGALGSLAILRGLGRYITKGGGLVGRLFGAGAAGAGEVAAGTVGTEAVAGTAAAGAGAAGTGLLASGAALTGAGLAGWGIGTGLNKLWDDSKVGSRANDAIFAIASSPLEAVALKFRAMSDPTFAAYLNSLSDKQVDDAITKRTLAQNPTLAAQIQQSKQKADVAKATRDAKTSSIGNIPSSMIPSGSGMQSLFDTITKGEGGLKSYDALYAGSNLAMQMFGKPLSQLTIGQVKQVQAAYAQQQTLNGVPRDKQSDAAGAFQIMGFNMNKYANAAGLTDNDLFNQTNQQKMAIQGWNRPGTSWQDFISGKISPEQMLNNVFSNEYASIANTSGTNRYANDGINHPSLFAPTMLPILKQIQDQALNNNSTPDLMSELMSIINKLVEISSKNLDINSKHLEEVQKESKKDFGQDLAMANVEKMKKISQTASQAAFNNLASYGVKPS